MDRQELLEVAEFQAEAFHQPIEQPFLRVLEPIFKQSFRVGRTHGVKNVGGGSPWLPLQYEMMIPAQQIVVRCRGR
jgi:hypothetical protein